MRRITISTKTQKEIVDITNDVQKMLEDEKEASLCHLFLTHTTAALTTADLDPGTDLDMLDAFETMMPKLHYRHKHNPAHAPDHILSSVIGASLTLPVVDGKLILGEWQRVVLVELHGPGEREIIFHTTV